jgi:hypothetical protein
VFITVGLQKMGNKIGEIGNGSIHRGIYNNKMPKLMGWWGVVSIHRRIINMVMSARIFITLKSIIMTSPLFGELDWKSMLE